MMAPTAVAWVWKKSALQISSTRSGSRPISCGARFRAISSIDRTAAGADGVAVAGADRAVVGEDAHDRRLLADEGLDRVGPLHLGYEVHHQHLDALDFRHRPFAYSDVEDLSHFGRDGIQRARACQTSARGQHSLQGSRRVTASPVLCRQVTRASCVHQAEGLATSSAVQHSSAPLIFRSSRTAARPFGKDRIVGRTPGDSARRSRGAAISGHHGRAAAACIPRAFSGLHAPDHPSP